MTRNLNHRVEVVFPVESKTHIHSLRKQVLVACLRDNMRTRRMQSDGRCVRLQAEGKDKPFDIQRWLMDLNKKGKTK